MVSLFFKNLALVSLGLSIVLVPVAVGLCTQPIFTFVAIPFWAAGVYTILERWIDSH